MTLCSFDSYLVTRYSNLPLWRLVSDHNALPSRITRHFQYNHRELYSVDMKTMTRSQKGQDVIVSAVDCCIIKPWCISLMSIFLMSSAVALMPVIWLIDDELVDDDVAEKYVVSYPLNAR